MSSHTYRTVLSLLALIILSGCSNGRGSVGEAAAAGDPPPAQPAPPQEPPPEEPPPQEPIPEDPPPEEPPQTPDPPEPEPPAPLPGAAALAGYWSGRIVDVDAERERMGVAFVDRSGDMQVLAVRENDEPEFVLHGNVCCAESEQRNVAARRYLSTRDDEAELEARTASGSLQGRFELRNRAYEFELDPRAAYAQALTLADLAGVYTRSIANEDGADTMTLTIDPDGTLTGSHSNGCIFNGTVAIPDPARNMVQLSVELSSCGGRGSSRRWNGDYRGLGVLLRDVPSPNDGTTRADVFHHSLIGPTWLGPFELAR
jgi:hypothetical protein